MPRGQKISLDEKIAKQQEVVDKLQNKLDAETELLQSLIDKRDEERRQEILTAIDESGKSMDEVIAFLKN